MEQHDIDDAIDVEASDYLEAEIPSKLWDKAEKVYERIMFAQVERKVSGKWRTLEKRIRFGKNGPPASTSVESICHQLIVMVQHDTESRGEDGAYRAMFTVSDKESPRGYRRVYAPIETEITPSGDISVSDSDEHGEREQLFYKMYQQESVRMDAVFERTLQMMDKNLGAVDRINSRADEQGKVFNDMARGLTQVVNAATNAISKAGEMTAKHQEEAAVVQLARLDQQTELQKLGAVAALLQKVGGPLAAQIAATIAGKQQPQTAAQQQPQQSRTAAALAASQTSQTPATTQDNGPQSPAASSPAPEGLCSRFKTWVDKLNEQHRNGLKEIVGAKHFDAFLDASNSGSDDQVWTALCTFKSDFDARAEVNAAETMGRLIQINHLLGEELSSEFAHMLPNPEG